MVNSEDIKTTENSHTYPVAEHYVRKIKSFELYLEEDRNLAEQYIGIFSMKKSLFKKNILDWLLNKITGQGI